MVLSACTTGPTPCLDMVGRKTSQGERAYRRLAALSARCLSLVYLKALTDSLLRKLCLVDVLGSFGCMLYVNDVASHLKPRHPLCVP